MLLVTLKVEVQINANSTTVCVLIMLCQLTVDYDLLYLGTNHYNEFRINYFAYTADLFNDRYNKCNNLITSRKHEKKVITHTRNCLYIIANFKTLAQ